MYIPSTSVICASISGLEISTIDSYTLSPSSVWIFPPTFNAIGVGQNRFGSCTPTTCWQVETLPLKSRT